MLTLAPSSGAATVHKQLKQDLIILVVGCGVLFLMAPPAGLLIGAMIVGVILNNCSTGMYDGERREDGSGPGQ